MRVVRLELRDFRTYERAAAPLGGGLTIVSGPNGAGKTNLLEALYFGCTGHSCRTHNDRELVRFAAHTTRVTVHTAAEDGEHVLAVGFTPGEAKRATVDGAPVQRLLDSEVRPLVSVFMPDRLALIKGVPALRRAHLGRLIAALWPSRDAGRRAYAQVLAQRNALLGRLRAGLSAGASLDAWDAELAHRGAALMSDRREAVAALAPAFERACVAVGLDGEPTLRYRPRSHASDEQGLLGELRVRRALDIERGFTAHGPHRDELSVLRGGRELRTYGSQGQQRLALLALLLAEREVISAQRVSVPLLLLDDVVSELDGQHRSALLAALRDSRGQALITTTDARQLLAVGAGEAHHLGVMDGRIVEQVGV